MSFFLFIYEETEAGRTGFKEDMLEIARQFLKEKCDERGNIAKAHINEMVEAGIKELKSKYLERKVRPPLPYYRKRVQEYCQTSYLIR